MFWKKKIDNSGYEELLRRIITLEVDQSKIFNLMNSLRGLVNRKVGEEEPDEELGKKSKSTDIKGGVLLPEP